MVSVEQFAKVNVLLIKRNIHGHTQDWSDQNFHGVVRMWKRFLCVQTRLEDCTTIGFHLFHHQSLLVVFSHCDQKSSNCTNT